MDTLGQRLQQARVQAGLSLREISTRTKIREALLDAMERDDFGRLPAGLLARGFFRAYAREVGLDPESVARQFQDQFQVGPTSAESPPPAPGESGQIQPGGSGRGWQWRVVVVAGVAVAVFIYLNHRTDIDDDALRDPIATISSPAGSFADLGRDFPDAVAPPPPEAAVAPVNTSEEKPLTIAIDPTGRVWVEAIADGTRVLYHLLQPGERQLIEVREELLIRVGDAGAFQYSINGVRGRQVGGPGAVREIRITRDNYASFQDR
ncbi:MAG: DUF4115 domain-containing protein [Acidobacteria bacterium]|nr:DUF4115 domain-containing protein [Acidobacteriota bacterium]